MLDYRERHKNLRIDNDLEQKDIAAVCNVSNFGASRISSSQKIGTDKSVPYTNFLINSSLPP